MPVDGRPHDQGVRRLDAREHVFEVIVAVALAVAVDLVLGKIQLFVRAIADELARQARCVAILVGASVDEENHTSHSLRIV